MTARSVTSISSSFAETNNKPENCCSPVKPALLFVNFGEKLGKNEIKFVYFELIFIDFLSNEKGKKFET